MLKGIRISIGTGLSLLAVTLFAQSTADIFRQAERDMDHGLYLQAEEVLSAAVHKDPRSSQLWFMLGLARARQAKIDPAMDAFTKALPLTPDKAPVYFNLGLLHMQRHELIKAEEAYRQGLALNPFDAAANQNYALVTMEQGDFREAAVSLRRLKSLNRSDVSTRASLIQADLKSNSRAEAIAEIDELLQSHMLDLSQGLELAKILTGQREIEAAQHLLDGLATAWPASPQAHGELGLFFAQTGDTSRAEQELSSAVRRDPESERYSLAHAEALLGSQKYSDALSYLLSVQSKFGRQPKFRYQLALTHMYLLRFSEATGELENLASDLPRSAQVQFLLAGCYEVQGELPKAEASYRMAIRINPTDATYYRALGSMLQKEGPDHLTDAEQALVTSLSLDPNDPDSKVLLARCLQKQGRLEEAATLLEQTVRDAPGSRRAHTALAELYLHQRQMERAAKEQEIAASLEDEKMKSWDTRRMQSFVGP